MKPSTMAAVVCGVFFALVGFASGIWLLVDRSMHGGVAWHYWFAPFLAIGFGALFAQLVVLYWVKVGRTEQRRSRAAE